MVVGVDCTLMLLLGEESSARWDSELMWGQ